MGGDACWQTSTFRCLEKPVADSKGMFDKGQKANPFLNYTIVNVLYCSGDLHMGMDKNGSQVQLGVANTESVIAWTLDNFPAMESLVISGSGAGSLEAQIRAKHLLTRFEGKFARGLVLTDSFFGVRPPTPINNSKLMQQYNFCSTPVLLDDGLVKRCRAGNLTVMDMFVNAMRSFPGVSFAAISSKTDRIQIGYYHVWAALEEENKGARNFDDSEHFLVYLNDIFRRYNEQPNFVSYLLNGVSHDFLEAGTLYTADPLGPDGRGLIARPKLVDWISSLLGKNATAESVCSGRVVQFGFWENDGAGDMFCDESQHGKTPAGIGFSFREGSMFSWKLWVVVSGVQGCVLMPDVPS